MGSEILKLRILALHGYRQSAKVFSAKLGGVRKRFKRSVEFVFITAPHEVPAITDVEKDDNTGDLMYGWWFNTDKKEFKATVSSENCFGFEESVALVQKTFEESGPFDGIISFSQGAAFAAILCSMKQKQMLNINFDFVILISGFKSLCAPHKNFYSEKIIMPSFHVYGTSDTIIPLEKTQELDDAFCKPKKRMLHDGGHYVGKDKMYFEFFEQKLQEKMQK